MTAPASRDQVLDRYARHVNSSLASLARLVAAPVEVAAAGSKVQGMGRLGAWRGADLAGVTPDVLLTGKILDADLDWLGRALISAARHVARVVPVAA